MASESQPTSRIWGLARRQYGVAQHRQLRSFGLTDAAIRHRIATGRLHPKWPGVYAVGRAQLGRHGNWMGAVLACGEGAVLSHLSAATLWGFWVREPNEIEVSVPTRRFLVREGLIVHRPRRFDLSDATIHKRIPVTSVVRTVTDLAARLDRERLEEVVNEAVRLGFTTPAALRRAAQVRRPGARQVRELLENFVLTQSRLERLFMPIALRAGLPRPLTQQLVNGYRVDFYWPDLGLVVETDGGAFHRSAGRQTRDRRRDQAHFAAGLDPLRFTHAQIAYDQGYVERFLRKALRRVRASRLPGRARVP